ncbi:ABC transporter substrate-binding protein [Hydrogenibacillus schlegelii]|uniref:Solute-binding protein family 5 domain-containing protein n=1 Tax=Hydrogenibacillus schlegelii TaxID=1484 RepID=A0A179IL33_HYDSH|nr:ABC transporter substrate-binding protein [Hydrogenibacillus schlegelii]OAR03338.1 hypothetical protein SA87_04095 [Hydrogenibacillus schlegelii]
MSAGRPGRRISAGVLIALAAAFLSGCPRPAPPAPDGGTRPPASASHPADDGPVRGGTLKIATEAPVAGDPLGLEEAIVRPDPSWSLVYRGLVRLDGGRLVGDLARDVRIERAGETVVVRLRLDGARFDGGAPVTAADVRRSLSLYLSPFYTGAFRDHLSALEGSSAYRSRGDEAALAVAEEGDAVVLRARTPTALFFRALQAPIFPAAALPVPDGRAAVRAFAERIRAGEVPGTGPYRVAEAGPGRLVLVRAETPEGRAALLDRVEIATVEPGGTPEGADVLIRLRAGERPEGRWSEDRAPLPYVLFLAFDVRRTARELRQAAAHLDRTALAEALQAAGFRARPEAAYGPPGLWTEAADPGGGTARSADRPVRETGGEKSNAGKGPADAGGSGALSLAYDRDHPFGAALAPAIVSALQASGWSIAGEELPREAFYAKVMAGEGSPAFLWPLADPDVVGEWWRLLGTPHDVDRLGLNVMHFSDSVVDRALSAAYRAIPGTEDGAVLRQAFERIAAAAPLVPLVRPEAVVWVREGVHVGLPALGRRPPVERWWKAEKEGR